MADPWWRDNNESSLKVFKGALGRFSLGLQSTDRSYRTPKTTIRQVTAEEIVLEDFELAMGDILFGMPFEPYNYCWRFKSRVDVHQTFSPGVEEVTEDLEEIRI